MEWLPALFANEGFRDVAYGALLTVVISLILVGRLIPKGTHEKILAAANKRGDEWKEAAEKSAELAAAQSEQLAKFAEASKTPSEFFETIMRGGEDHVRKEEDASHS